MQRPRCHSQTRARHTAILAPAEGQVSKQLNHFQKYHLEPLAKQSTVLLQIRINDVFPVLQLQQLGREQRQQGLLFRCLRASLGIPCPLLTNILCFSFHALFCCLAITSLQGLCHHAEPVSGTKKMHSRLDPPASKAQPQILTAVTTTYSLSCRIPTARLEIQVMIAGCIQSIGCSQ